MVGSTREVETRVSITNESTVEYEEGKDEVNENSFDPHGRNVLLSFTSFTATYILLKNSPFQVIYDIAMSLYDIKKRMSHACHVT